MTCWSGWEQCCLTWLLNKSFKAFWISHFFQSAPKRYSSVLCFDLLGLLCQISDHLKSVQGWTSVYSKRCQTLRAWMNFCWFRERWGDDSLCLYFIIFFFFSFFFGKHSFRLHLKPPRYCYMRYLVHPSAFNTDTLLCYISKPLLLGLN